MTTSNGYILVEDKDGARLITINRPEKHNAVTESMRRQISQAISGASWNAEIGAVVITGEGGKAFCVGADLSEVKDRSLQRDWSTGGGLGRELLGEAIATCSKPTIAAMRGHVIGLGFEIALACSLRVAGDDCSFAFPEMSHQIIPGSGGTQRLPRIVGPSWAADLILTGRRIDASTALNIGLVTRVVPTETVLSEAIALAAKICEKDSAVMAAGKLAIERWVKHGIEADLELEGILSTLCLGVRDQNRRSK